MIRINLLPKELKPHPRRSTRWIAVTALLCTMILLSLLASLAYSRAIIPSLATRLNTLKTEQQSLHAQTTELVHIERQADAFALYTATVEELYSRRIIWSRFLHGVREVFKQTGAGINRENETLRLIQVAGHGRRLRLEGEVSAGDLDRAKHIAAEILAALRDDGIALHEAESKGEPAGLAKTALHELVAEGWPRLIRVEPVEASNQAETGAARIFAFVIEMLVR